MRTTLLIIITLFLLININAQVISSGNLSTFVDSLISVIPDTSSLNKNKYIAPSALERATFASVLTSIIAEQYATAHTDAGPLGYQLIQYSDTSETPNKTYYLLLKTEVSSNYWGSYFFNPSSERQRLVIQSPHPVYDTYTGAQGFFIFKNVGARAFFMAGAHRCNSSSTSTCDGTTTVCTGSTSSFMISDQAHSEESFFQRGTETLAGLISNLIVIQVHGFSKQLTDPDVIMSNGTRINPSGTDYLDNIKSNLLVEDNTLTFKIPNVDTTWDRLNGTTNLQGRFINGSGDPCGTAASASSGRFIHIEQKKDGLRNPSSNWSKLANAISNSIPLEPLPVEINSFTASATITSVVLMWETATEVSNYGFYVERRTHQSNAVLNNWGTLGFVLGNGTSNSSKFYSFTDTSPHSGQYQYRLKQMDVDGEFKYSSVIEVSIEKILHFELNQNYPNPFNPETTIRFQIPQSGNVSLNVYDVLGRKIATLVDEYKLAGKYEVIFNGKELASGVYFYRLQSGNFIAEKKIVLIE